MNNVEMIWVDEHVDYNLHLWVAKCSNCHITTSCSFTKVSIDYEFCPHCGAKAKTYGDRGYDKADEVNLEGGENV